MKLPAANPNRIARRTGVIQGEAIIPRRSPAGVAKDTSVARRAVRRGERPSARDRLARVSPSENLCRSSAAETSVPKVLEWRNAAAMINPSETLCTKIETIADRPQEWE